jgi:hypothetical protein
MQVAAMKTRAKTKSLLFPFVLEKWFSTHYDYQWAIWQYLDISR